MSKKTQKNISNSVSDTQKIAQNFLNRILSTPGVNKDGGETMVVGLNGDLGVGKTTFTQMLAKCLGVRENVTSPTFVLLKRYKLKNRPFKSLVHIDVYRLDKGKDLDVLGFEDVLKKENAFVLVEWADRIKETLPKKTIFINFSHKGKNRRSIDISFVE